MNDSAGSNITSRFATVQGYQLHFLELGQGPVVLLLHGFAGSAEDWRSTLPTLAGLGYRAIALDILGFGRSAKPAEAPYGLTLMNSLMVGLLDQLGISAASVIAHSMGGKYALALALEHPERVNSLVLVATDGFVEPSPMVALGGMPLIGASILWIAGRPSMTKAMLDASFADPERYVTAEVLANGQAALLGADNRRALTALSRRYAEADLSQMGLRARFATMNIPILVIWGSADRVFDLAVGKRAVAELPGAVLVVMERCGHFPQIEAARQFRGVLAGFLAGL